MGLANKEKAMADTIDELKETEKAKLNAAFEAEQDALKAKQNNVHEEQSERCFAAWGLSAPMLIGLGLIFLVVFTNWHIGWWIVPLIFLVMCKSGWGRC
jgi:hypothetical protein